MHGLPGSLRLTSTFPFVGRTAELELLRGLLPNAQTESPTTKQVEQAARKGGVPEVAVTETLPVGVTDYVAWMTQQVDALSGALDTAA